MYQSVHGIKKECPTLDGLNIGGSFPIKTHWHLNMITIHD
jgi:hypothetical protein